MVGHILRHDNLLRDVIEARVEDAWWSMDKNVGQS